MFVCVNVYRYISKLESAQSQYIAQVNDLKEVDVFAVCRQITGDLLSA